MTVLEEAPDLYSVTTESGAEYTVDARTGACDCPWAFYNPGQACKHRERVAFATAEKSIPEWVDETAADAAPGLDSDDVYAHALRATAASYHASRGLETIAMKSLMGWSELQTAEKYVSGSDTNTQRALRAVHSR